MLVKIFTSVLNHKVDKAILKFVQISHRGTISHIHRSLSVNSFMASHGLV